MTLKRVCGVCGTEISEIKLGDQKYYIVSNRTICEDCQEQLRAYLGDRVIILTGKSGLKVSFFDSPYLIEPTTSESVIMILRGLHS